MPPAFDVVVLGAGGFTGRLVCEHIARDYQVRSGGQRRAPSPHHAARAERPQRAVATHAGRSASGSDAQTPQRAASDQQSTLGACGPIPALPLTAPAPSRWAPAGQGAMGHGGAGSRQAGAGEEDTDGHQPRGAGGPAALPVSWGHRSSGGGAGDLRACRRPPTRRGAGRGERCARAPTHAHPLPPPRPSPSSRPTRLTIPRSPAWRSPPRWSSTWRGRVSGAAAGGGRGGEGLPAGEARSAGQSASREHRGLGGTSVPPVPGGRCRAPPAPHHRLTDAAPAPPSRPRRQVWGQGGGGRGR